MKNKLLIAAAVFVCAGIYVFASSSDYDVQQKEAKAYADNVCAGVWPNYKNVKLECGK